MVDTQQYEKYWKVTLAYTDIYDEKFRRTLEIIRDFIDTESTNTLTERYVELQNIIHDVFPIQHISIRKSINQFIKLGFVSTGLKSYHININEFLNAKSSARKRTLFSKIVYENSSLNSSVKNQSKRGHISFLIKTLEEIGKLSYDDILGLMRVNIDKHQNGFLTQDELDNIKLQNKYDQFLDRKYNQLSHFISILKNLDRVQFKNKILYFDKDAERIKEFDTKKRDNYRHCLFKSLLKYETSEKLGYEQCMVETIQFPTLVASHIKPWIVSKDDEAYEQNNGLLLTSSMDALFDKGHISFKNNGDMIISNELHKSTTTYFEGLHLKQEFLNSERSKFLRYHREHVLRN